ncbi:PEP/pyruvate-binding domain-containing protein [Pelosinus sp. sgz500959]|uniref:PEP/pyruvate-binding domain-containing protein n=1 Tax=Pelosinus sp. sgz500959 TaxID=3242472 RepID=UPI00366EB848
MYYYIKNLRELNRDSLSEAGGKGANLGELTHAGFPVPPGFVVTTGAYRALMKGAGLEQRIAAKLKNLTHADIVAIEKASKEISSWIEKTPIPTQVQAEVGGAFEELAKTIESDRELFVAVRSSATAEDLPSASFAGQHETFLGILGKEAVLAHMKKCWISLWTPQAITYRLNMDFDYLNVDLAVVVQAMIDAEVAGVMFTANPVIENRNEILISAGYGLGETVVSGLITPDTFIITKGGQIKAQLLGSKEQKIILTAEGTMSQQVPLAKQKEYCLDSSALKQLAALGVFVEQHYGQPQDTEWAYAKGNVYLLQARPITTMKSDQDEFNLMGPEDNILYQGEKNAPILQACMTRFTEPMKALDFACLKERYRPVRGVEEANDPIQCIERESGCIAVDFSQIKPFLIMPGKKSTIFNNSYLKDANELWQPLLQEMNTWLKEMEEAQNSIDHAEKLAKRIQQGIDQFGNFFYKRMAVIAKPGDPAEDELNNLINQAVGNDSQRTIKERLLRALPFKTALQNNALVQVAKAAVHGKHNEEFAAAFRHFLDEYGDRPSVGGVPMLGVLTWRERPEVIHNLIDALLGSTTLQSGEENDKKQQEEYEAGKKQVEKELMPSQYQTFEKLLHKIRQDIIIREESAFMVEKLTACIRRMIVKLGSLLAEKNMISEPEDVFHIFREELSLVAAGKLDITAKIQKRKQGFAKVCAAHEKGVHWMVATGSIAAFTEDKKESVGKQGGFRTLAGISASSGVYEGKVCIVKGSHEFTKLKRGDILVSTVTTPIWTPLFKIASAVVTQIGSPTSHAAIVAREYGIPAVVAVAGVTSELKDGQKIRVDGTKGILTLLLS